MSYSPNTEQDRQIMLQKIGVKNFEELISAVPEQIQLREDLKLSPALSEMELSQLLSEMAKENKNVLESISFLGGGAYDHFIPSVINHIISRSEFYTAYTPYQAEVSQGTLQSIYEYQSLICELTGMDVSNASMYDAATAVAEAALLSHSHTGREEIIFSGAICPNYRKVLETYSRSLGLRLKAIPMENGLTDLEKLKEKVGQKTACVIVQSPNFFGLIENIEEIERITHNQGGLLAMISDPISLGILKPPGEYKADIAVGEGQVLGNSLNFGGPYLGYFAAKMDLIRRMPGRIIGTTTDQKGDRGFVLTLQTREQHIRREKATSNICTNESLCALAATVYLSLLGKNGVQKIAHLCLQKSHYAFEKITQIPGFKPRFSAPFFKEFVVETPIPPKKIIKSLLKKNIFAGIDLDSFKIGLKNALLVAVTERRTKEQIDSFVAELSKLV
jgi:glycine dehydrogenase subunit 1